MDGLAGLGGISRQRSSAVTTTNHLPTLLKRLGSPKVGGGRSRRPAVAVVDGVQMSCHELDDDLAVIQFVCPPPRKRRALRPLRET
jgi:hypothetical protein